MMLHKAMEEACGAISVPAGLERQILTACHTPPHKQPIKPALRLLPAAVAAVACAGVLLVGLFSTGKLPGFTGPVGPLPVKGTTGQTAQTTTATEATTGQTAQTATATEATTGQTAQTTARPDILYPTDATMQYFCGILEEMSVEQLEAHFGRPVRPRFLPADLQEASNASLGVYRRAEEIIEKNPTWWKNMVAKGYVRDEEIVSDCNTLHYAGEGERNLTVKVSTAPYPRAWMGDLSRFKETVAVKDITVKLAYYDNTSHAGTENYSYTAYFTVGTVDYILTAWNIPRQEFLQIVESLI